MGGPSRPDRVQFFVLYENVWVDGDIVWKGYEDLFMHVCGLEGRVDRLLVDA